MLIVADGYKVAREAGALRFKRGLIDAATAAQYEAHKHALLEAARTPGSPLEGAELLEQHSHCGFALGVHRGLRAAQTDYVLVAQHDRPLLRDVPMRRAVQAMDAHTNIAHVGM